MAQLAAHDHKIWYEAIGVGVPGGQTGEWILGDGTTGTVSNITITGSSQSHTHSMTNVSSGSANSIPPYYVLSYIMRTM